MGGGRKTDINLATVPSSPGGHQDKLFSLHAEFLEVYDVDPPNKAAFLLFFFPKWSASFMREISIGRWKYGKFFIYFWLCQAKTMYLFQDKSRIASQHSG